MLEDKQAAHNYRIKITSLQALVRAVFLRNPLCRIDIINSAFEGYVVLDAPTAEERALIRHCILNL